MARKTTSTQKSTPRKASTTRKESPAAKPKKPIFSTGTWITVILLIGLIAAALYINRNKEITAAETTPTNPVTNLFSAEEGNVSSIEIKPADGDAQRVKVARNAENVWALELPIQAEADQGLVEAAATQVAALEVITPVDDDPSIFGFDAPAYMITIEFASGKAHTLEVGDITPTQSGYYVRLDEDKMMIVSLIGIESLLNLVNFPPYLNTPTPTALPPTETPVPPTEAREASTLEATITPTP